MIKDVEQYPDAYQKEHAERFGVCQKAIELCSFLVYGVSGRVAYPAD
ncbi:hypothetical protein [Symbiopectobacterium sp. RP]